MPRPGARPRRPRPPRQTPDYDILIRNGRLLDGTGNPAMPADVGIRSDEIVAVGDLADARARRTIDAAGKYVTSGFVAMHEHIEDDILDGYGRVPNYNSG